MTRPDNPQSSTEASNAQAEANKAKDDRQARLSQALRDNLRRRKAQSRSRKQAVAENKTDS